MTIIPHAYAQSETTTEASSSGIAGGLKALGVDGKLLAAQILNFIILVIILRKFLYQPLLGLMEKRRLQIEESQKKAEEVEKRYAEFQIEHVRRIEESKAEATALIEKAKTAAESLRQDMLAATQAESDKLLERTKAEIERQKESMLAELKHEIGGLVITVASKLLGREIDPKTETKFIEEAIREVKQ